MKTDEKLKIKIFSPYLTYFQGEAVSLSAKNRDGRFDILPGHTNFLSLLPAGKVKVNTGYQELDFDLSGGLIKVTHNQITLFANL
jgi:F0F1-type ATP synthase epsilon subunit